MSEHAYVVRGTDPGRAPLMLLHGSNGRETDLLDLAQRVSPTSTRVGLRGTVTMSRGYGFFRRHEERRVDESDLRGRVPDLAGCIRELAVGPGDSRRVAVGFSNGAIMAAALLMSHPSALGGAVLFRPLAPFEQPPRTQLQGVPVLVLDGAHDERRSPGDGRRLAGELRAMGARVTHQVLPVGHAITRDDERIARLWLRDLPGAGGGA